MKNGFDHEKECCVRRGHGIDNFSFRSIYESNQRGSHAEQFNLIKIISLLSLALVHA